AKSTYEDGPGKRRPTSKASDDLPNRRKPVTTQKWPACALANNPETSRSRSKNWLELVTRPRTSKGLERSEASSASSNKSSAPADHFNRLQGNGTTCTALVPPRAAHSNIARTAPRSGDVFSSWTNSARDAPYRCPSRAA